MKKNSRTLDAHLDRSLSISRRFIRIQALASRVASSVSEAHRLAPDGTDTDPLVDLLMAIGAVKAATSTAIHVARERLVRDAEARVVRTNLNALASVTGDAA